MKDCYEILDSLYDGIWICDQEGKVIYLNKASEKFNSLKAKQVIGKSVVELMEEGKFDRSVTLPVLESRKTFTIVASTHSGTDVLLTGSPVFHQNGEIKLVVINERDITDLNRLRQELEESRSLAQKYRIEISQMEKLKDFSSVNLTRSEVMQKAFKTALKVAQVDSTIMIRGESGVGKGYMAKFIHQMSARSEMPFMRVDCSAIPETLIESELFGYERGAFTGAHDNGKPGLFEVADNGTLLLDEVGEIPLNVQVKLLRFLEENEIVRVGGSTPKKIKARVISATHRNLKKMIDKGKFREDLFFRLNVVPIQIPSLRERVEDIPPLINFFAQKFNKKYSKKKNFKNQALDSLCKYSFPGNIRELANLVERLVVLTTGNLIGIDDLPSSVRTRYPMRKKPSQGNWNLKYAVADTEKEMITRALKYFKSQRKAASPLGINQSTLARKVKRYNILID
jgi:PAS domain S-box-containing protein